MLERFNVAIQYIWALEGRGRPEEIDEILATLATARPGAAIYLRPGLALKTLFPDIKAADFSEMFRTFKNLVLGGAAVPEGWFADADAANRASLVAQGDPTFRAMLRMQSELKRVFRALMDFAVERAADAGWISPAAAEAEYEIVADAVSPRDDARTAEILVKLQSVIDYGTEVAQAYTREEGARAFRRASAELLGISEDLPPELEAAINRPRPAPSPAPAAEPEAEEQMADAIRRIGLPDSSKKNNGAMKEIEA